MAELIYLDTYVLQKDMRVRMPKSIITNLNAEKGKTMFAIFLDKETNDIVLRAIDNGITEKGMEETND